MICPIDGDPEKRYSRPYNLVWCADLNHPSISTTTYSKSSNIGATKKFSPKDSLTK